MSKDVPSYEKYEAIKQGIKLGIFQKASRYAGDHFYVALTNKFVDEYNEQLGLREDWEKAMQHTVLKMYNKSDLKISRDILATLMCVIRKKKDFLKKQNIPLTKFMGDNL